MSLKLKNKLDRDEVKLYLEGIKHALFTFWQLYPHDMVIKGMIFEVEQLRRDTHKIWKKFRMKQATLDEYTAALESLEVNYAHVVFTITGPTELDHEPKTEV